jgi:hypothetical protein
MALARLRQLSAHEIGHTIGLAHNFAASVNDRASVMDYPHPLVTRIRPGKLNFDEAYDDKIGDWDKRTILYGYQDFPDNKDEQEELEKIIEESQNKGFHFISDDDARPSGGANPIGHLWDNGEDPVKELERMMTLRMDALSRFGQNSIPEGTPFSELEKVLVPLYLMPRYQIEAVSKRIGGYQYTYKVKGDELSKESKPLESTPQRQATEALLEIMNKDQLKLDEDILELIFPPAFGFPRDRETFRGRSGVIFDPLAPAESLVNHILQFLLQPERLYRLYAQDAAGLVSFGLSDYLKIVSDYMNDYPERDGGFAYKHLIEKSYLVHMLKIAHDPMVSPAVSSMAGHYIEKFREDHEDQSSSHRIEKRAHNRWIQDMIEKARKNPGEFHWPKLKPMPPGSPIGCSHMNHLE